MKVLGVAPTEALLFIWVWGTLWETTPGIFFLLLDCSESVTYQHALNICVQGMSNVSQSDTAQSFYFPPICYLKVLSGSTSIHSAKGLLQNEQAKI